MLKFRKLTSMYKPTHTSVQQSSSWIRNQVRVSSELYTERSHQLHWNQIIFLLDSGDYNSLSFELLAKIYCFFQGALWLEGQYCFLGSLRDETVCDDRGHKKQ